MGDSWNMIAYAAPFAATALCFWFAFGLRRDQPTMRALRLVLTLVPIATFLWVLVLGIGPVLSGRKPTLFLGPVFIAYASVVAGLLSLIHLNRSKVLVWATILLTTAAVMVIEGALWEVYVISQI